MERSLQTHTAQSRPTAETSNHEQSHKSLRGLHRPWGERVLALQPAEEFNAHNSSNLKATLCESILIFIERRERIHTGKWGSTCTGSAALRLAKRKPDTDDKKHRLAPRQPAYPHNGHDERGIGTGVLGDTWHAHPMHAISLSLCVTLGVIFIYNTSLKVTRAR